jgi:dienelactone hydrolase
VRRLVGAALLLAALVGAAAAAEAPDTVSVPSGDGNTGLVGYLYRPLAPGPHPALVLLHGRGGLHSSLAKGVYTPATLSRRHATWPEF